jgi:hypothetical protein
MRIELKIEGGIAYFPGLAKPRKIDSQQLSKEESTELERLVDAAHFFDLAPKVGKVQQGAADYRQYTIQLPMASNATRFV